MSGLMQLSHTARAASVYYRPPTLALIGNSVGVSRW